MAGCGCLYDGWGKLFVLSVKKLEMVGERESLDLGFVKSIGLFVSLCGFTYSAIYRRGPVKKWYEPFLCNILLPAGKCRFAVFPHSPTCSLIHIPPFRHGTLFKYPMRLAPARSSTAMRFWRPLGDAFNKV